MAKVRQVFLDALVARNAIDLDAQDQTGPHAVSRSNGPTVSVGMPVYNGAATIERAISAVLRQTFQDFELIIADNASIDKTLAICEQAARFDSRIRIISQTRNLGPVANFEAVLEAARGRFFMFAAADDHIEPHFIAETLSVLEGAPWAVACAPRTLIHAADSKSREGRGSIAIKGPPWYRVARFLLRPADNSRFYGLYRTKVMKAAYHAEQRTFHAFDWAVSALTLVQGAHLRSRSVILNRQAPPAAKYYSEHRASASGSLNRFLPLAPMSASLLTKLSKTQAVAAFPLLVLQNVLKGIEYIGAATVRRFATISHARRKDESC